MNYIQLQQLVIVQYLHTHTHDHMHTQSEDLSGDSVDFSSAAPGPISEQKERQKSELDGAQAAQSTGGKQKCDFGGNEPLKIL